MTKKTTRKKTAPPKKPLPQRGAERRDESRDSLLAKYQVKLHEKLRGKIGPFLYRGQEDAEWHLWSGAARRIYKLEIIPEGEPIPSEVFISYHKDCLLGPVKNESWHYGRPDGQPWTDMELLALLQHQGAATCLLDFSGRPDIALWFACQGANEQTVNTEKNGAIFIVDIGPGEEYKQKLKSVEEQEMKDGRIINLLEEKTSWCWRPRIPTGRIINQGSQFLFSSHYIPEERVFSVEIHKEDKVGLLNEMRQLYGLNRDTVFPDIYGFADANTHDSPLEEKQKEKLHNVRDEAEKKSMTTKTSQQEKTPSSVLEDGAQILSKKAQESSGAYEQ